MYSCYVCSCDNADIGDAARIQKVNSVDLPDRM